MLFKHFKLSPLKNPSVSYLHEELESLNKLKIWLTEAWSIYFNDLFESSAWFKSCCNKLANVVFANLLMLSKLNKSIFTELFWWKLRALHYQLGKINDPPIWFKSLKTRPGLQRLRVIVCSWFVNKNYDMKIKLNQFQINKFYAI
jgi:hypothetical protein